MRPSTEVESRSSAFAADVLRNLLIYINQENAEGTDTFLVSHGWTNGPVMYLVYKAPPSAITWGLVRDTRESIIDPAPWPSLEVAVRYYYLLDLCENRVSASFPHPGNDPDVILWHGDQSYNDDPCEGLPQHSADIPDQYLYTHPPTSTQKALPTKSPPIIEPRRYADPNEPLPPEAHSPGR
jgi:hypothetical protein